MLSCVPRDRETQNEMRERTGDRRGLSGHRLGADGRDQARGLAADHPPHPGEARKMPLLLGHYEMFFTASAGASAAILGLLVGAVSVVNAGDTDPKTRERRTVLAGSEFLALVDAFFVSIVALTGGAAVFATSKLVMTMVGLFSTSRLIPRAKRAGVFSPRLSNSQAQPRLCGHFSRGLRDPTRPCSWPTLKTLHWSALLRNGRRRYQ